MKILGVDPGLKATGYGLIEVAAGAKIKLIAAGSIEPKTSDLFEHRIYKVHYHLDQIVGEYKPDIVVLEKLYAHYKHPTTACILGHVRGVICLVCAQRKLKLVEHSVKRIRQALTGNGNATKEQTQRLVVHLLKIKVGALSLDTSDALALALGHAQMMNVNYK